MQRFLLLALFAVACKADGVPTETDSDTDTDSDADTDSDTDTDADSDTDSDTDTDICQQPLACTAGIGETAFTALNPGMPVEMFHGQQGGWHVNTAVRVDNTSQVVRILPKITVVSSGLLLAGGEGLLDTYNQALVLTGPCSGEAWQVRANFDETPVDLDTICSFEGEDLLVEIEVTDDQLNTTSCSATGVAALHPDDVDYCGALP